MKCLVGCNDTMCIYGTNVNSNRIWNGFRFSLDAGSDMVEVERCQIYHVVYNLLIRVHK